MIYNKVLTNFRMKCVRITFEERTDGTQPINLVVKIIGTTAAVAAVTELTVGKTVAVPRDCLLYTSPSPRDS